MQIFASKPALRWLAPAVVVGAVATTTLVAANAQADKSLPPISAEQLLVDLQKSKVDGLSGTVVQQANLGVPAIPGAGGQDSAELTSLISGTHTLRVRYAAPDKARLAVFSNLGETDTITNGKDVWSWSSKKQTATHRTLTGDKRSADRLAAPADAPKTPEEAAQKFLTAITPSTTVSTDASVRVADRDAYELVLDPNDDSSKVKQVRIAVDNETRQPLRVQVLAANKLLVAEVAYSQVSFTRPDDQEFEFKAPRGTSVTEAPATEHKAPSAKDRDEAKKHAEAAKDQTKVVGTGWTSVVVRKIDEDPSSATGQLGAFLDKLPKVDGTWGSGRLLNGTAFSAVVTDDGRVAIGSVEPDLLYAALNK